MMCKGMKVIVKTKMNVRMKKDKRIEKEKGKILWVR